MKSLYISTRWPWPATNGRERMIAQTLQLCAKHGDTHLLAFSDGLSLDPAPSYVASSAYLTRPSSLGAIGSLLRNPLRPIQSHLLNSDGAVADILEAVERLGPDVVVFDMLRTVALADALRRRFPKMTILLDMDDRLSLRYARMITNGNTNILATFSKSVPGFIAHLVSYIPAQLLRLERMLMLRSEAAVAATFDGVLMVSALEAENFRAALRDAIPVVGVLPWADISTPPADRRARTLGQRRRYVFHGSASSVGNSEALVALDRVASLVFAALPRDQWPAFQVAGKPNANLSLPSLENVGYVDDLGAFLDGSILVAPIFTGSGIKTKLVDAFSRSVPVLTTPVGAEGLALVPNEHYIEQRTVQDFCDTILLIENGKISEISLIQMGQKANLTMRNYHSPERVTAEFRRLLKSVGAIT